MSVFHAPVPRVADASPCIGLAKVGRLDVLSVGGRVVLITDTVAEEIQAGREDDPARQALQRGWGTRPAGIQVPAELAEWHLDAGEEATLALARHIGGVAVLDDGNGRKAARALGIAHTGTIGLVVEARRQGIVTSAAELLRRLYQAGLFLPSDAILQALLQTVGEDWP